MLMQPEQPIQPTYVPPPIKQESGGFTRKQKRLIMVVGILLGIFVVFLIVSSVFGGKAGPTETTLTSVTARNSGLLTLIDTYEDDLTTEEGKAYATQARILIQSDNNQLTSYTLSQYSSTHTAQQIDNTGLPQTTSSLADRVGQISFDGDFISTIQFEVKLNQSLLQQLNQGSISQNLQEITTTAIQNYQALL